MLLFRIIFLNSLQKKTIFVQKQINVTMNIKQILLFLIIINAKAQNLSLQQANKLASLPLKCLQKEYPNKLNQMLLDSTEILSPKTLHPTFYGCFDWHSSVHGHWSLAYLLKNFDELENKEKILKILEQNLSASNIQNEIFYLQKKHENSFERTYGWTWILKLQHELESSKDQKLVLLSQNLMPLSDLIISNYQTFLPKLLYPIRNGTHTNTAFGLAFAWDYAIFKKNRNLQNSIKQNALRLFLKDKNAPFNWEPSGTDFLSPNMEEISIMRRILPKKDFLKWLKTFAPSLFHKKFTWDVAKVSDRTDGHLVHLDGLNFSRAWNFYELIGQYPKQFSHLLPIANKHLQYSLPTITDGNYEGEHWLASFALHAFEIKRQLK